LSINWAANKTDIVSLATARKDLKPIQLDVSAELCGVALEGKREAWKRGGEERGTSTMQTIT